MDLEPGTIEADLATMLAEHRAIEERNRQAVDEAVATAKEKRASFLDDLAERLRADLHPWPAEPDLDDEPATARVPGTPGPYGL